MAKAVTIAKTEGQCGRCGGIIKPGDKYLWSNLHHKRYHLAIECPAHSGSDDRQSDLPAPETLETPESESPSDDLVGLIARAVQKHINAPKLDEGALERLIDKALSRRVPSLIEIKRADLPPVVIEGAHYLAARVIRLAGAGIHTYLWGPAGSGKTTMALQIAHAIGLVNSELDTLDQTTPKSSILGYRTPTGAPVETSFTRTYANGQGYIADETDNAPAQVQTLFNSALANGHAPTAWGPVKRGDGFVFLGTGNTPGRPTPAFPDRRPMSPAFMDRLYFVHVPIDPAIECRAGGLPIPKAPKRAEATCTPAQWVTWVQTVRAWASTNAPTLLVTPRASLVGLQALSLGETPLEAAHALVFRGADQALIDKALHSCPLPE